MSRGFCLLLLLWYCPVVAEMSAAQLRGQHIYLHGETSRGEEIQASLNAGNVTIPASVITCVNCHGYDGRGRAEGGVVPSDLRWQVLTKPYAVARASGRSHQPYDLKSVKRAISMGMDASGNPLNATMPRYNLTLDDMDDLLSYLQGLGSYSIPGVTDDKIALGVIHAGNEQQTTVKTAVLEAVFAEVNLRGGIFQRHIQLEHFVAPTIAQSINQSIVNDFIERLQATQVFAYVASDIDSVSKQLADFSNRKNLPLVGTLGNFQKSDFPLPQNIFNLFSGYHHQAQVLASFARQQLAVDPLKIRIIVGEQGFYTAGARQLAMTWKTLQPEVIHVGKKKSVLAELVTNLKQKSVEQVFLLGDLKLQEQLVAEADRQQWQPKIFMPAVHLGDAFTQSPIGFQQKIHIALPSLPQDYQPVALDEYRQLQKKYNLPPQGLHLQLWSMAASKLMLEGLTRSGRDLSQQKLVQTMQDLYQFNTGLTRLVSYGPNRRNGTNGAYIVRVDLESKTLVPVSDWLSLN